jgi:F-type H+-transporting ATPase subunit b
MEALAKLGIDGWGLVLYLVNFSVVLFLMYKYVYTPLLKYIDERRAKIKESVQQAEALRETVEAELQAQKDEQERHLTEQRQKISEAQKFAKQSARELIEQADNEREHLLRAARKQAADMQDGILAEAENEMKKRVQEVILKVLKDDVPERTVKKSVSEAVKTFAK